MAQAPILYVEDEEDDVLLMQMGFRQAGISHPLLNVSDGEEAIAYLSGDGQYADRDQHPLPGVVLLDLNLPLCSGFEVLRWIRGQPQFQSLPVVVVTSSGHPGDLEKTREFGANDYVQKSSSVAKLGEMARQFKERWLDGSQGD